MPEGVSPTIRGRDFTVATIAGAVKQEEETPGSFFGAVICRFAALLRRLAARLPGSAAAAAPAGKGGAAGAKAPAAAAAKPAGKK